MVAGPGEDLREMIARLEQQELDCQVRNSLEMLKHVENDSDGKWQCACSSLHRVTGGLPCRGRAHKVPSFFAFAMSFLQGQMLRNVTLAISFLHAGPNFYGRGFLQRASRMVSCQEYGQLGKVILSEVLLKFSSYEFFVFQLSGSKTALQCMLVYRASGVRRYFESKFLIVKTIDIRFLR